MNRLYRMILASLVVMSAAVIYQCGGSSEAPTENSADLSSKTSKNKALHCKGDKTLEEPHQILSVTVTTPSTISLTAGGGSDKKTNRVLPDWYEVTHPDSTVEQVPSGIYVGDADDLLDISIGGLVPGQTYSISLLSQDLCKNLEYSEPRTVTLPAAVPESNAPTVGVPIAGVKHIFIAITHWAFCEVSDDTALKTVQFFFDGEFQYEYPIGDHLMWWLNGGAYSFRWYIPEHLWGRTGTLTVRARDIFDNESDTSVTVTL